MEGNTKSTILVVTYVWRHTAHTWALAAIHFLGRLTIILTLLTMVAFSQDDNNGLQGTYQSIDNGFERYSTMILLTDNRFIYKTGVGGCQVKVTGTWTSNKGRLNFRNDDEFLNHSTIFYPNLSLVTWTVKKFGIKPEGTVDSGCLKDDKLHRKK